MEHIIFIIYLVGVIISAFINYPTHKRMLDTAVGYLSLIVLSLTSWLYIIALTIDLFNYLNKNHENTYIPQELH